MIFLTELNNESHPVDDSSELVVRARIIDILTDELMINATVQDSGDLLVGVDLKPLYDALKSDLSTLVANLNKIRYT